MCDGVASKLLDDAFNSRMIEWRQLLGTDKFATWMCNGVASKLLDDAFNACMLEWRELVGTDKFVTLMCNGLAARWQIIPKAMIDFIAANTWTQAMTQGWCRRIPLTRSTIDEGFWLDIFATMSAKRKR
jgi:hypothetical protein